MSTLNAITSGAGGVALSGDTSGNLTIQSAGVNVATFTSTGMISNVGAPAFSAYASSNQSITTGWNKVALNAKEFDTNNNFNTSTNRFTPTVAGYYQISGGVAGVSAITTGEYLISIYKNGSEYKRGIDIPNGASLYSLQVSSLVYFNGSTDYIELYCYNNAGSPTPLYGQTWATYMTGSMVRSA